MRNSSLQNTQPPAMLTIPCHWDMEVMHEILSQNESALTKVGEVYGVLAQGGPVGHGRSADSVARVSREEAVEFRTYVGDSDIKFTYLLNAPFKFSQEQEQHRALDEYLNWILRDLRPDALTISSLELMEYVRSNDSRVPIHISTIAGVKTALDLEKYLKVRPNRVVPHHDVGKNRRDLEGLVHFGKQNGVEVELMVTESCLYKCPSRSAHYEYLARGKKDEVFHLTCNAKKMINPCEFLMAGGVVRPEDLTIFEDIGVSYFKITGRSKPAAWLPETVRAYQDGSFDGNLVRLLGIDPSLKVEEWFYIDNKGLDGFAKHFPTDGNDETRRDYCDEWIVKLYREGKLSVSDGTEYFIEGNKLRIVDQGGECVSPIIRREMGC